MTDELINKLNEIKVPNLDDIITDVVKDRKDCEEICFKKENNLFRYERILRKKLEEGIQNIHTLKDQIINTFNLYEKYNIRLPYQDELFKFFDKESKYIYSGKITTTRYQIKKCFKKLERSSTDYYICIENNKEEKLRFSFNKENNEINLLFRKLEEVEGSQETFIENVIQSNIENMKTGEDIYFDFAPYLLNEVPNWLKYANKALKKEILKRNIKTMKQINKIKDIKKIDFEI